MLTDTMHVAFQWTKLVTFIPVPGNCKICSSFGNIWPWKSPVGFTNFGLRDAVTSIRCQWILWVIFSVKYIRSCFMYSHQVLRGNWLVQIISSHYNDVIMVTMASQITSLTMIVHSTVYSAQIKENIKAPRHWPLCGEFTGDRWIPRTKDQ